MTADPYVGSPDIKDLVAEFDGLRQYLLLRAVLADRERLANPEILEDLGLSAALELAAYDRRNCTWAPGRGPDSSTWKGNNGALEYVRFQWKHRQEQLAVRENGPLT